MLLLLALISGVVSGVVLTLTIQHLEGKLLNVLAENKKEAEQELINTSSSAQTVVSTANLSLKS